MVLLRHKGEDKRPQRRKSREKEETGLLQDSYGKLKLNCNFKRWFKSITLKNNLLKNKEMVVQQRLGIVLFTI